MQILTGISSGNHVIDQDKCNSIFRLKKSANCPYIQPMLKTLIESNFEHSISVLIWHNTQNSVQKQTHMTQVSRSRGNDLAGKTTQNYWGMWIWGEKRKILFTYSFQLQKLTSLHLQPMRSCQRTTWWQYIQRAPYL